MVSESLTTKGLCSEAAAVARTDRTIRSPTVTSVTTEPEGARYRNRYGSPPRNSACCDPFESGTSPGDTVAQHA